MSKCCTISNIYYSRKKLKPFGLEIFSNIRDISTENYNKSSCIIFCTNFLKKLSNIYFGTNVPKKSDKKKIWTISKWLNIHKDFKWQNTIKLYTLKALLSKNWFYFFFLIFCHAKIPPYFRMPRYWHPKIFFTIIFTFFKFSMLDKKSVLIKL